MSDTGNFLFTVLTSTSSHTPATCCPCRPERNVTLCGDMYTRVRDRKGDYGGKECQDRRGHEGKGELRDGGGRAAMRNQGNAHDCIKILRKASLTRKLGP